MHACHILNLLPEPLSTQVIPRDRHAEYINALAFMVQAIERFSIELRLLHRDEVAEVQRGVGTGHKGSSAMPHKINPWPWETLVGIARVMRGYLSAMMESCALWHERDISHSSVERIVMGDATNLAHWSLQRFLGVMQKLIILSGQMYKNLEHTNGRIYSEGAVNALTEIGIGREQAYSIVQSATQMSMENNEPFHSCLKQYWPYSVSIPEYIFNPYWYVRHRKELLTRALGTCTS